MIAPERVLVIPAAGRGSRLGGSVPKPLVPVAGRPMLDHLFELYSGWVTRFIVVVNPESGEVIRRRYAESRLPVTYVEQQEPTGMLDAILLARPEVAATDAAWVWITWADQIAVRRETASALAQASETGEPAMVLPVLRRRNPYTHLERDRRGRIVAVRFRREGDAMPPEGESEIGLFALRRDAFLSDLPRFAADSDDHPGPGTGERNFLPFIPWLARQREVVTFPAQEDIEAVGVNTPEELAAVEAALLARSKRR